MSLVSGLIHACNVAGSDLAPPALPPSSIEIWKALVAGGVSGIVSRTITAPLEKAKIIAQVSEYSVKIDKDTLVGDIFLYSSFTCTMVRVFVL